MLDGRPMASAADQPNMRSAPLFQLEIRPCASCSIEASPSVRFIADCPGAQRSKTTASPNPRNPAGLAAIARIRFLAAHSCAGTCADPLADAVHWRDD